MVYHPYCTAPDDYLFDYSFSITPLNPSFGLSHPPGRDKKEFDVNLIDDWIDDSLLEFVRILDRNCNFSVCMCSYICTSRVLTCINDNAVKILMTHDVMTGRNKRLYDVGIRKYEFGTTADEEKKGLDRSDYVIAVSKQDKAFFEKLTKKQTVTIPYILPKRYRNYYWHDISVLRVGYMASDYAPNIYAISEFIKYIDNENDIQLYVGGSIATVMNSTVTNVKILGLVDDLDSFYSEYDVYINPDMLNSGLKVKTVEALSYGVPFVSTKSASTGLDVEKEYHKADSVIHVVKLIKECTNNMALLDEMAEESRRVYDLFYNAYNVKELLEKMIKREI
jgi:glycosyltransferase involved in cell wall biosynthesis